MCRCSSSNIEGCPRAEWEEADRDLAAEVVRRLVHLVATVSPGAKLGSTAPYANALMVLIEDGNAQPRTLANAFLEAVSTNGSLLREAQSRLNAHLGALDDMYGASTERRFAAVESEELAERAGDRLDLPTLASWAAARIRGDSS